MEKKRLTKEMLESQNVHEAFGEVKFEKIGFKTIQEAAMELAKKTVVPHESGVCYRSYLYGVYWMFILAKYMTNIDTAEYENDEGIYVIADFMRDVFDPSEYYDITHDISEMYDFLFESMKAVYEKESSISYRVGGLLDDLIGEGDVLTNLAHSPQVNEKMIDALDALINQKNDNKPKLTSIPGSAPLNFSKKKK